MDAVRGMSWDARVADVLAIVGCPGSGMGKGLVDDQSGKVARPRHAAPAARRDRRRRLRRRHHIGALRTLDFVEVVGVADLDGEAAHAMAKQFAIPHAGSSLAELAEHKPDAIYVLTPPARHAR